MFRKLTVRIRQVLTGRRDRRAVSVRLRRQLEHTDRRRVLQTLALT